jgi:ribonuclease III
VTQTGQGSLVTSAGLLALQQRLGHVFGQSSLLQQALTHKSFGTPHYERLEFLGDTILNAAVSDLLYEQFADQDEGDLTRIRAHLVRQDTLHKLAMSLEFPALLRLSDGEAKGGGAQRASILADALEAVIGAVFLDSGFDAARALVTRLFKPLVAQTTAEIWQKDPKTALQEWLQGRKLPLPVYRVQATRGKAHEQTFVVECELTSHGWSVVGEGLSKRLAEQEAAQKALQKVMT